MLEQIGQLLYDKGYRPLDPEEGGVLVREDERDVYVVTLSVYRKGMPAVQQYQDSADRIRFRAANRFRKPAHLLNLVATPDENFTEGMMRFVKELPNTWLIAADTARVYVFENQPQQFDDLYAYFERGTKRQPKKKTFTLTPVNLCIVIANVLCFVLIILVNGRYSAVYDSELYAKIGALDYDSFMGGKYYEVVTSLFLHFGLSHLLNNMILLLYAGCQLEKLTGGLPYLMLYLVSGVCGNFASLWYYHRIGEDVLSAGASGAIFGVIGALFVLLSHNRTNTAEITPGRLMGLAFFTIYYGMTTIGVDNAAHIGGLISGIIGGFLLSKVSQYGKLNR